MGLAPDFKDAFITAMVNVGLTKEEALEEWEQLPLRAKRSHENGDSKSLLGRQVRKHKGDGPLPEVPEVVV